MPARTRQQPPGRPSFVAGPVIIDGPPGSGKTTLARRIAQLLEWPVVLEPAGRSVLPPRVPALGPVRRELFFATLQFYWLRRARSRRGARFVADFSPLKSAIRLAAAGRFPAARLVEGLGWAAIGPRAAVVVLSPSPELTVERCRQRGPDELSPARVHKLTDLALWYGRFFGRPCPRPILTLAVAADTDPDELADRVLQWLVSQTSRTPMCGPATAAGT